MAPGFLAISLAVVVQLSRTFTASPKKEKGRQAKKKYQATQKQSHEINLTARTQARGRTVTTEEQASMGQGSRQSSAEGRPASLDWENSGSKPIRLPRPLTGENTP